MNPVSHPDDAIARRASEQKSGWQHAVRRLAEGDRGTLATWLRHHLFSHVLPFWEQHAVDPQGGLFTCISDEGAVLSTDKWLWSQWRAVWVFSRIYRTLDSDPRWLRLAQDVAGFCLRTGWDESANGWALVVAQDGRILRGYESVYVDAFAVYGLAELHAASQDPQALSWARRTADAALEKLARPYDTLPHFPYPIPPGAKPHGIPMLWSLTLAELGAISGEQRYLDAARRLADEIFRDHYRPESDLFVEFVRLDGSSFPPPVGTAVVPGHVIEDMWFQHRVAQLAGTPADRIATLYPAILRHLELGWDAASGGGIRLALDADGREPVGWNFADSKLWWPHTEALYATLLGWMETGQPEFLRWYDRIGQLCLDRYVDWRNGEWRQKLDRSLQPITEVVALPVKDPFHLPRSLILQIELLEAAGRVGAPSR